MRAFVVDEYGPDALRAAEVPEPTVGDRDVLVDVAATEPSQSQLRRLNAM